MKASVFNKDNTRFTRQLKSMLLSMLNFCLEQKRKQKDKKNERKGK